MRRIIRALAQWLLPASVAGLMLLILQNPGAALESAMSGILLWARAVLPALLPYFILSQTLVESGAVGVAGRYAAPLTRKLFRLPGDAAPAFLLALISGSPAGARIAGQLRDRGALSADQAARLCSVAAMAGPLFLTGTVGGTLLGDARAGLLLLLSCLIAAILNGLLWRGYGVYGGASPIAESKLSSPLAALPTALRDGTAAVLAVGAAIALFSVILRFIDETGTMDVLTKPFSVLFGHEASRAAVIGVVELTNGCQAIAELPLPLAQKTVFAAGIAGFGGLSVAVQASVFLQGKVKMGVYLLQRVTQAALSVLCAFVAHPLFLPEIAVSSGELAGGWCPLCIAVFMLAVIVAWLALGRGRAPKKRARATCWEEECFRRYR